MQYRWATLSSLAVLAGLIVLGAMPQASGAGAPKDRTRSGLPMGQGAGPAHVAEPYPYQSVRFNALVADSYPGRGVAGARRFYDWMDKAYAKCPQRLPGTEGLALGPALRAEKATLSQITDSDRRAETEQAACAQLHRIVKTIIPHFSLDRGFEFRNVVRYGERQCFLQAVLIAGLLQRMGIDAGVVMVYRNPHGEQSNNGHAVTLVKLADGADLLVDASEPEPFPHHRGLFVRKRTYQYVEPTYDTQTDRITAYRATGTGDRIDPARLRTLDYGFIRSQFWYYRGERAEGGLLSAHRTKAGLEAAGRALRRSVTLCPENPLSTYMLGRVYLTEGQSAKARGLFAQAYRLYSRFGWVPAGPKQYLGLAGPHGSGRAGA